MIPPYLYLATLLRASMGTLGAPHTSRSTTTTGIRSSTVTGTMVAIPSRTAFTCNCHIHISCTYEYNKINEPLPGIFTPIKIGETNPPFFKSVTSLRLQFAETLSQRQVGEETAVRF